MHLQTTPSTRRRCANHRRPSVRNVGSSPLPIKIILVLVKQMRVEYKGRRRFSGQKQSSLCIHRWRGPLDNTRSRSARSRKSLSELGINRAFRRKRCARLFYQLTQGSTRIAVRSLRCWPPILAWTQIQARDCEHSPHARRS